MEDDTFSCSRVEVKSEHSDAVPVNLIICKDQRGKDVDEFITPEIAWSLWFLNLFSDSFWLVRGTNSNGQNAGLCVTDDIVVKPYKHKTLHLFVCDFYMSNVTDIAFSLQLSKTCYSNNTNYDIYRTSFIY